MLSIWHHYCFTAALSVKGTVWSAAVREKGRILRMKTAQVTDFPTQLCSAMSMLLTRHEDHWWNWCPGISPAVVQLLFVSSAIMDDKNQLSTSGCLILKMNRFTAYPLNICRMSLKSLKFAFPTTVTSLSCWSRLTCNFSFSFSAVTLVISNINSVNSVSEYSLNSGSHWP